MLRLPLKLLAEKVETREQMEFCRSLGFHLFQGYYFARPTVISGRQLSASQLGIIRLINLVARDADSADLEASFKREPGLTVNLLRLVNAEALGLARRVELAPGGHCSWAQAALALAATAADGLTRQRHQSRTQPAAATGCPARAPDGNPRRPKRSRQPGAQRPRFPHRHHVADAGSAGPTDG
ncbi:MAG: EAL domain-containing protein [Betaproteobacteria bacterium]|nr:EAL domain-containing protein [Betaproteobacteria bacterium]